MKCHLHDYSGYSVARLAEELENQKLEDGFHVGYFSYSPTKLEPEKFDKAVQVLQEKVAQHGDNLRALYQEELPLKLDITPATAIGDLMVAHGINPLYPRRFSDWCVIQCTRYVKNGHVFWFDVTKNAFTNETPASRFTK